MRASVEGAVAYAPKVSKFGAPRYFKRIRVFDDSIEVQEELLAKELRLQILLEMLPDHSGFLQTGNAWMQDGGDAHWNIGERRGGVLRVSNLQVGPGFRDKCRSRAVAENRVSKLINVAYRIMGEQLGVSRYFYANPRSFFVDNDLNIVRSGSSDLFSLFDVLLERCSLSAHFPPLFSHQDTLPDHLLRLPANYTESPAQQEYLQSTDYHQQETEYPRPPICPVPPTVYRHGGQFADRYGTVCIFVSLPINGILMVCGFWSICIRRLKLRGIVLLVTGVVLDFLACASGAIGCLPWDWWRCLHDGQQHSQRKNLHGGTIVLLESWHSVAAA